MAAQWSLSETVKSLTDPHVIENGSGDAALTSVATDSRTVRPGALFFALPGTRADGGDFAADAVRRGAAAVVTTRQIEGLNAPQVIVPNARRALAQTALRWYGSPDRELALVGVTGTNGKTTVVRLISTMAGAAGFVPATVGTLGATFEGAETDLSSFGLRWNTTPEAHDLRIVLNQFREKGASLVAMEVSSIGLDLDRVWGMRFACAVFTNLTEDHLDFHGTLEAYFDAKTRLFLDLEPEATAIINADDPYGRRLVKMTRAKVITYGWSDDADIRPEQVAAVGGIRGRVSTPAGSVDLDMPLVGRFNVANALATVGVGVGLGMATDAIAHGLGEATPAPGRFEPVGAEQDFTVVVDYAHTPDALENVLHAAREMTDRRVICVVGCGGDRDPYKRPVMGAIATRLADVTVFASDNPRTEDPDAILDAIVAGAKEGNPFERIEPRRMAIRRAIALATAGDVVVIAGKGHEPYQEIGTVRYPFDDRVEARQALEERRSTAQT